MIPREKKTSLKILKMKMKIRETIKQTIQNETEINSSIVNTAVVDDEDATASSIIQSPNIKISREGASWLEEERQRVKRLEQHGIEGKR